MSQVTVTDTAQVISISGGMLQNLGPSTLYVGDSSLGAVTPSTGVRVDSGECIAFVGGSVSVSAVADGGQCDVRMVTRGGGIFDS